MPRPDAIAFFEEHAGASSAFTLAVAEEYVQAQDWVFAWEQDEERCAGCECGSESCPCFTGEWHETECCILYDRERDDFDAIGRRIPKRALASLCGICGATTEYRRVVEAELALEAMPAEVAHA